MKTMHILAAGALTALLLAVPAASQTADMLTLSVSDAIPRRVEIASGARTFLISPAEGLWSVATDWADGWPSGWVHASPAKRLHPLDSTEGLSGYGGTIREKYRFALSRFRDRRPEARFEMFPDRVKGTQYVMGWAGQSDAGAYATLGLAGRRGACETMA